jgi:hypothetical protein
MPGTSYEKVFDDVTTISNASSAPGVVDQTFREHDVWKRFADENHRVSSTFTQDRYEFKVKAGRNKSLKYFQTTTAEVDLFDTQHMTTAWVPPAILGGVIVYNDIEKEQVEGSQDALISLQRVKMEALEDSFRDVLSENLYGDGAAGTTIGLGSWVPVSPGSYTVANLSEATYDVWNPFHQPTVGAWKNFGGHGATKDLLRRAIRAVADGTKKVDILVCDDETANLHHDALGAKVEYHNNAAYGKVGEWEMTYMGIPIVPDRNCDDGTVIGLRTKYIKLVVSPGMNMKVSGTRYLEKSPLVSYNFVVFRHQLVFLRRNVHFRFDGITA